MASQQSARGPSSAQLGKKTENSEDHRDVSTCGNPNAVTTFRWHGPRNNAPNLRLLFVA